ncbi:hypothetical protein E4Z66_06490 [Aliishimia ponticola]|uniref:HPt domain-containing protein n=1 Tax=Aliishimia ponticola TaxID=2499833 RepID=A0A4S4NGZ2_9RHOB|nr:hypothetical protein E4Z66_06490 [Aliishimia ponticola]
MRQLIQDEPASLDHDQLGALYTQLGALGAEDVVRRAMEELALRLSHAERQYRQNDLAELRKGVRSLVAIAEQIGMQKVALVAADVRKTIDQNDDVAIAATLARLLRVGERSLTAIWDLQDQV